MDGKWTSLSDLGSVRTLAVQGYTDRDRQVTNQHIRREGRHLANLGPLLFGLFMTVMEAIHIVGPISNELYSVSVFSWPVGKHKSTARKQDRCPSVELVALYNALLMWEIIQSGCECKLRRMTLSSASSTHRSVNAFSNDSVPRYTLFPFSACFSHAYLHIALDSGAPESRILKGLL
ncbi:hypothetical protein OIU79_017026 [Salix purpurea]|uniref:Uncharacterized protein n=1 Tax=Salix purpurea TaxID=77065 RepID=A0A9Q0WXE9_SALPP|nr:hypothetical protein OIU79_017026 [Salix purpurea]